MVTYIHVVAKLLNTEQDRAISYLVKDDSQEGRQIRLADDVISTAISFPWLSKICLMTYDYQFFHGPPV